MIEEVVFEQLKQSRKPVAEVGNQTETGLYAVFLAQHSSLDEFAKGGGLIYLGKAEEALAKRVWRTHFTSGKTGSSTLRRTIGAILKRELSLSPIPRSPKRTRNDLSHYKFTKDGEDRLTSWMKANLEVGFFVPEESMSAAQLQELERKVLRYVKAPLDLDNRTKHFNPMAGKLEELRSACIKEAEESADV